MPKSRTSDGEIAEVLHKRTVGDEGSGLKQRSRDALVAKLPSQ
jgi:hypothetical protein